MGTSAASADTSNDYDLPAGRLMRVQRARGWAVYCEFGELLLTQEGDARDFVMKAGERAFINTHGRVLVESSCGSRLRLLPPAPVDAASLGRPVVRLLRQREGAGAAPGCAANPGPLTYARVSSEPRLMEQLVAQARRERNALIAACLAAGAKAAAGLAKQAVRLAIFAARSSQRFLAGLRPRLPSLHETFSARIFLRSRL